jgi:hypothetical protein
MKNITNNLTSLRKVFMYGLLALVISVLPAGQASAQNRSKSGPGIETAPATENIGGYDLTGTWETTITPDDGTPSFQGFYTFNADGTASFSSAGPPLPALGNPGYGVWKKTNRNNFAVTIKMNSYDESFQFAGRLKINLRIRMAGPNTFITNGDAVTVYDVDGKEIITLSGSEIAHRMIVEN